MTDDVDRRVGVFADLTLRVDDQLVTVRATPGGPVVADTADPAALWTAISSVSLPPGVIGPRAAASLIGSSLAAGGVQAVVTGPDGTMLTVGHGVDSALGRWLLGSAHVRPGRWRALSPTVRTVSSSFVHDWRRHLLTGRRRLVNSVRSGFHR